MSDHEATEPRPDDRDAATTADLLDDEQSTRSGEDEGGGEGAPEPGTEPK